MLNATYDHHIDIEYTPHKVPGIQFGVNIHANYKYCRTLAAQMNCQSTTTHTHAHPHILHSSRSMSISISNSTISDWFAKKMGLKIGRKIHQLAEKFTSYGNRARRATCQLVLTRQILNAKASKKQWRQRKRERDRAKELKRNYQRYHIQPNILTLE